MGVPRSHPRHRIASHTVSSQRAKGKERVDSGAQCCVVWWCLWLRSASSRCCCLLGLVAVERAVLLGPLGAGSPLPRHPATSRALCIAGTTTRVASMAPTTLSLALALAVVAVVLNPAPWGGVGFVRAQTCADTLTSTGGENYCNLDQGWPTSQNGYSSCSLANSIASIDAELLGCPTEAIDATCAATLRRTLCSIGCPKCSGGNSVLACKRVCDDFESACTSFIAYNATYVNGFNETVLCDGASIVQTLIRPFCDSTNAAGCVDVGAGPGPTASPTTGAPVPPTTPPPTEDSAGERIGRSVMLLCSVLAVVPLLLAYKW